MERPLLNSKIKKSLSAFAGFFLLWFTFYSSFATVTAAVLNEYEVKAAFLFQFTKFVNWPEGKAGEFNFCTEGSDPFGKVLDELEKETVESRPIKISRDKGVQNLDGCQLVFISSDQKDRTAQILRRLTGKGVLTVGETPGFLEQGGIINFVRQQNRIRFEISQENADKAGIKISSKLMGLAANSGAPDA